MRLPLIALCATLVLGRVCAQSPCFDWSSGLAAQGIDSPNNVTGLFELFVADDGSGAGQRLFAGGTFTSIGGVAASNLAAWDGTSWHSIGSGVSGLPGYLPFMGGVAAQVDSLCLHDDGSGTQLYVGGAYTSAGGHPATGLARWDGHNWTSINGVQAQITSMVSFDDGNGPALFVAGYLDWVQQGTLDSVMYWRGGTWHTFSAPPSDATTLCLFDDGSGTKLYSDGGVPGSPYISRWDGTQWSGVGGGFDNYLTTLCVHDDGGGARLYAGGAFTQAGGQPAKRVARWDGTSWSAVGNGIDNGAVNELTSFSVGFGLPARLVATGSFTLAAGQAANHVVAWDGASWNPLGAGLSGVTPFSWTYPTAVFDDGQGSGRDLYVGGVFSGAGGHAVSDFAKWEGCGGTGTPFCAGDGSLSTPCPCANFGATGHGCASSQVASGGRLDASGAPSADTLTLDASQLRVGASCIFLQGDAQLPAGAIFGDGVRCVGGQLLRLALKSATNGSASFPASGDPSVRTRSAALGAPIPAHASRYYQVYYRDSDASFCPAPPGNTWNVTNGMRIVW